MTVLNVTSAAQFYFLIQNPKPAIVNFTASWCGPCKLIKPYFEYLAKIHNTIQFLQVDVDQMQDVAQWAQVSAMPTFIAYKSGFRLDQIVGINKDALDEMVKKLNKLQ